MSFKSLLSRKKLTKIKCHGQSTYFETIVYSPTIYLKKQLPLLNNENDAKQKIHLI